jgi:hypothetical protein
LYLCSISNSRLLLRHHLRRKTYSFDEWSHIGMLTGIISPGILIYFFNRAVSHIDFACPFSKQELHIFPDVSKTFL